MRSSPETSPSCPGAPGTEWFGSQPSRCTQFIEIPWHDQFLQKISPWNCKDSLSSHRCAPWLVTLNHHYWSEIHQNSFEKAKSALSSAVSLTHPSPSAEVSLVTYASASHNGAVLQQPASLQQSREQRRR